MDVVCTGSACGNQSVGACAVGQASGDDGVFGTGGEACDHANGNGLPGAPRKCDDNNPCTIDSCDPGTDACLNDAGAADGDVCGNPNDDDCDNPDTCLAGACQDNNEPAGAAPPGACDDANDCTADACDGLGACTHPNLAAGAACGNPANSDCDNPDTCARSGTCDHHPSGACLLCGTH